MDEGPYFDDLTSGETLPAAPAITIDAGETALYQAISGDPSPLPLSSPLAEAVTGEVGAIVNSALVLHVSIGQSTVATRRVIANLFYRGVGLHTTIRVGDTLSTTVTIDGLKETTRRPDRAPRGLALLGIETIDQRGRTVAAYQRCAMLPFRDPEVVTDHADDLGPSETELVLSDWADRVPHGWNLEPLGRPGEWPLGETRVDTTRDTVTDAPALVRLTQNQAAVHRDATLHTSGRRLVYGGHTIGLAQASLGRLVPNLATVVGWHSCDHTAPVFEGDILRCTITPTAAHRVTGGRLIAYTVIVDAERSDGEESQVLDWKPIVYTA